jgi:hypothetical protein
MSRSHDPDTDAAVVAALEELARSEPPRVDVVARVLRAIERMAPPPREGAPAPALAAAVAASLAALVALGAGAWAWGPEWTPLSTALAAIAGAAVSIFGAILDVLGAAIGAASGLARPVLAGAIVVGWVAAGATIVLVVGRDLTRLPFRGDPS